MGKNRIYLYRVDSEYCDYLRQFDSKVSWNSDGKEKRPYIGVLINVNGHDYYAPLTSPKQKHKTMKNQKDFHKINGGLWGAINFNIMMPIEKEQLIMLDLRILPSDSIDEKAYKNLAANQWRWCNDNINVIQEKARKLYELITEHPERDKKLLERCCDFKLLEGKYKLYKKNSLDQRIEIARLEVENKERTSKKNELELE